jgi:hypothetical protein
MSMQVLPTAPSPTVTHLMNREALDAMAAAGLAGCPELEEGQGGTEEGARREGRGAERSGGVLAAVGMLCLVRDFFAK